MKTFGKSIATAAALAAGLAWTTASSAAFLPNLIFNTTTASFAENLACGGGWTCIAGEGAAPNQLDTVPTAARTQFIDWIVAWNPGVGGGPSDFYYFYSVENSGAGNFVIGNVGSTVGDPGFVSDSFFSFGGCDMDNDSWLSECDSASTYDDDGNNTGGVDTLTDLQTLFAGIDAEGHDFGIAGVDPGGLETDDGVDNTHPEPTEVDPNTQSLSASFDPALPTNEESGVWGGRGTAPAGVNWVAFSDSANVVWASLPNGVQIAAPGPVPEPATLGLVGLALLGAGFAGRRRRA